MGTIHRAFPHRAMPAQDLKCIPTGCGSVQPTVVLHQGLHLLLDALMPLGDVHMQRVVTAGFAVGPFPPLVEGGQQARPGLRHDMVN